MLLFVTMQRWEDDGLVSIPVHQIAAITDYSERENNSYHFSSKGANINNTCVIYTTDRSWVVKESRQQVIDSINNFRQQIIQQQARLYTP